ncbi:MAG: ABC transporter substrate-binding protein, partial [Pontibacterium sp.]
MNKLLKNARAALCSVCLLAPLAAPTAMAADEIRGNIRVVIGSSSTGGDTYQASSIIAEALSEKLNAKFKVDAVGASAAYKALDRARNGRTIMIFHDQAYLGHLYGKKGYKNPFENYIVGQTFAINPGNAYLAPKNSPYATLQDAIDAAGSGKQVRVAIQPGGVSDQRLSLELLRR